MSEEPAPATIDRHRDRRPHKPNRVGGRILAIAAVMGAIGVAAVVTLVLYDRDEPEIDHGPAPLPDLPGTFVPSQGRGHFSHTFSLEREPTPFCDGVAWSGDAAGALAVLTSPPLQGCYNSNPPASGEHAGVQRNVDVTGNGGAINIPPDPGVYPPEIKIPREAIPHILEHAGIYIGYHCPATDRACEAVVEDLTDITNDRIDNHDNRVMLARDTDLVPGTIALASWTRVDVFSFAEFTDDRASDFVEAHACRFDPGGVLLTLP